MIPKVGDKVKIQIPGLKPEIGIVTRIEDVRSSDDTSNATTAGDSFSILLDTCDDWMRVYSYECTLVEDSKEDEPSEATDDLIMVKTIDIHKIIDDAMEKKDRIVHIFITDNTTSVDVMPYEGGTSKWIKDGHSNVRCPECGKTRHIPTVYCPECGEKLAQPEGY